MSRSSPSVQRVVAVLNFMADHPGQAFTLTDIVRSLKLSRATCHALLTGLVEAGYLFRSSDKAYVLGPVLAAIGRQADAHFSPLQVAQSEMRRLADEFDVICSAVYREGSDIVVRERASSISHIGDSIPRGTRLPLRLPFGAIYFAWSSPPVVDKWIRGLDPQPGEAQLAAMHDAMEFARRHGFQVVLRRSEGSESTGSWPLTDEPGDRPVNVATQIDEAVPHALAAVTAPVFDERGEVAFVLALVGFTKPETGAEIMRAGQVLKEACARVTRFISGNRD
ncbi:MAG: helix-turn-helix domain-containing protein [Sphingomonadales bacterium]|nr:helix-turn-helix domain-containing protein [Sphingomonadales bacterium]